MKRITTLLLLCCFGFGLQAQLYVAPNTATTTDSFVYVQDEILFVEQDVNLVKNTNPSTTEASIYLRGEAQLIQGETNSLNRGTGLLSVFQEGTTDQWDYNNWTSPVSVPTTTFDNATSTPGTTAINPGNGTFGWSTIHTPLTKTQSSRVELIGGFDSMGGSTGTLEIPRYWFFYYPSGSGYNFVHVQDNNYTIPAGYAFTMKGVTQTDTRVADNYDMVQNNPGGSNQRYDFRGRPNSGTVQIGGTGNPITPGDLVYVGNPYPSAIDLSYFLIENSGTGTFNSCLNPSETITRKNNTTGTAYFWDSDPAVQSHFLVDYQGGYEIYTPTACGTTGMYTPATYFMFDNDGNQVGSSVGTGSTRPRTYAPIAQGFFIRTVNDYDGSTPITFENRHRLYLKESDATTSNVFKREGSSSKEKKEGLIVIPKLRLNVEVDETYTRQLALGFWPTATKDVDFAMDGAVLDVKATDAGFLHNNLSYGIDVRPFDAEDKIPLYLTVNEQTQIKFTATSFENFDTENVYIYDSETDYYYNVNYKSWSTTLAKGNYNGRFFLTFKKAEVLDTENIFAENFDVFQNNNASQLEIRNPNGIGLKSVAVFDISGKRVINERGLDNNTLYTFSTQNLQDAVYIVKITSTDNVESTQKITVSNGY